MTRHPATLTATAAMTITAAMGGAPVQATTQPVSVPPVLPAQVTAAIAKTGLSVQTNDGWEAITGSAGYVNWVRALATILGVGSLGQYTVDGEAGEAILVFSGNDDSSVGFTIVGAAPDSAANETTKTWAINGLNGLPDATLRPGTAEDITPVSNSWGPVGTVVASYVSFSFD